MNSVVRGFLAIAALGAFALPISAQQPGPVETRLEARKVVLGADGKESLVPADSAKPGDIIEYAATYQNKGRAAVKNLEATLPIPANTEFIPGSPKPGTAKASVDSRTFSDIPLKRTVKKDGKDVQENVPAREYRYLRWFPGELGGEKSVTYVARVKVIDDPTPATGAKAPAAKQ